MGIGTESDWTPSVAAEVAGRPPKTSRTRSNGLIKELIGIYSDDVRLREFKQFKNNNDREAFISNGHEAVLYDTCFGTRKTTFKPGDWEWHYQPRKSAFRLENIHFAWFSEPALLAHAPMKNLAQMLLALMGSGPDRRMPSRSEVLSPVIPPPDNAGSLDFWDIESRVSARGTARSRLASLPDSDNPSINLISAACRESLRPGKHAEALERALRSYDGDPLWPALARHLTRRATTKDRDLLVDLASHPEKREPPLRWGLQFIVRGDILMPDGSIRMLDDFFVPHGVPAPAYLEEPAEGIRPELLALLEPAEPRQAI
jgi:hypothetical protein